MKALALVVLLLVVSDCAARAQSEGGKGDLERAGLAGRVKSVELWRIEYAPGDGGGVEYKRNHVRETSYDEQGRRTEEVTYGQAGAASQRLVYAYDARGNWTRKTLLIKPAGAERAEPYWAEIRQIVHY